MQILSNFPQTKKSSHILKYLIKSVCAIAMAQKFDKLFDKLILGFVKKEYFTYKTRQEEDEYSTFLVIYSFLALPWTFHITN